MLQALLHASIACSLKPSVQWIAASDLEDESAKAVCYTNHSIQHFVPFASFRECLILNSLSHIDTKSTCCRVGDFTGNDINGHLLFHFSSHFHAYIYIFI